ncbi:hypothetical protein ACFCP7_24340 [Paenibacillus elgii]
MLTIRVTPQLHHVVYMLKVVDFKKNVSPSLKYSLLSDAESLAVSETFARTVYGKLKQPKEPLTEWN